jgi:5-(carboxyamino)imidazole ribonucleotide mutase
MNNAKYNPNGADVAIIMGSKSDWPTMKWAAEILDELSVSYESLLVSAHRTPNRLADFASSAQREGFKVIIAGTAYAAHLPGMTASFTDLPVIGVPIESRSLKGMDSLLSIVQMPKGIPVATCAIGEAGAMNAGILAAKILGVSDASVRKKVSEYRIALERDYAPALGSLP